MEVVENALIVDGFRVEKAEWIARLATHDVLPEILRERDRQDAKFGPQDHPSFDEVPHAEKLAREVAADAARDACAEAFSAGRGTWQNVLLEEVYEAMAEVDDDTKLEEELIQIAAVAVAWVESLRRKRAEV
ncbi:hypothetical protein [Xanthomonas phage JGB6]|nr:hypothetical protein [Xanthomonas phage JGB6]